MRGSNKPKDDRTLRGSIDPAFNKLSRDKELEIRLDTLYQAFRRDRSHALPALEAIGAIAALEWGREDGLERIPTTRVAVPWWVVNVLADGFASYAVARAQGLTTTLGEAYRIEGGGQGKNPKVTQSAKELEDMRLVMGIGVRIQQGMTVRVAIEAMIAENLTSLSFDRVEKIWAKHSEKARAIKYD
jgi:hypothetical protein